MDCLDITTLASRYRPGVTSAVGTAFAEAIIVCLDNQGHVNSANLALSGEYTGSYRIDFDSATDQMMRTHNDLDVAAETGAYGIAILLMEKKYNLTAIERSRKGTGFDYWLGDRESADGLFQNKARLEVSGIRKGDLRQIESRVKQKRAQIGRSETNLPGYVAVVEFSAPQATVIRI